MHLREDRGRTGATIPAAKPRLHAAVGGQLASWIGTEVTGITLPLLVLALTGSPARAGIVAAIRSAIYVLLALPAGALIDRWDRRRIMILANAGSGIAMGSICVALLLGRLTLLQLYVTCAAEGACFVFANLARFSALRRVVPPEQYPAAIAQTNMADSIALLVGPSLGGFLYQIAGAGIAILADACSYAINASSIFFIATPLQESLDKEPSPLVAEIKMGIVWLWNQRTLRHLNLLTAGRTAVASGLYLLVVVLARNDHASTTAIGGIFAVGALGGIAGAAVAANFHQRFRPRMLLWATTGATWVVVSCYSLATNVVLLAALTAAVYVVVPFFEVTIATCVGVAVPDGLRGRVSSLLRMVELASYSLGFLITGILLQSVGGTGTIVFLSVVLCALTLFARFDPVVRAL